MSRNVPECSQGGRTHCGKPATIKVQGVVDRGRDNVDLGMRRKQQPKWRQRLRLRTRPHPHLQTPPNSRRGTPGVELECMRRVGERRRPGVRVGIQTWLPSDLPSRVSRRAFHFLDGETAISSGRHPLSQGELLSHTLVLSYWVRQSSPSKVVSQERSVDGFGFVSGHSSLADRVCRWTVQKV